MGVGRAPGQVRVRVRGQEPVLALVPARVRAQARAPGQVRERAQVPVRAVAAAG